MFKTILIFLIVVLVACHAKQRNYEVKITKFETDPQSDPTWIDKGTLRVTKKSRNVYVISGTFYVFKNAGNHGTLHLLLNHVTFSGSLIPIYSKSAKFCDYLAAEKMMYPGLQKASNFPPSDQCPFPKGNYTVTDYVVEEENLPEVVPAGKYHGKSFYQLDGKMVFGYVFDFTVTPM